VPGRVREFLRAGGFLESDGSTPASSAERFPDGAHYRVAIPSVEGPAVLEAVPGEAAVRDVPLHRISPGSGVMPLTDTELAAMVAVGARDAVEDGPGRCRNRRTPVPAAMLRGTGFHRSAAR
jgi:hypothetical protein